MTPSTDKDPEREQADLDDLRDYIERGYQGALESDPHSYSGAAKIVFADYVVARFMAWHKRALRSQATPKPVVPGDGELSYGFDPASPNGDTSALTIRYGDKMYVFTGEEAEVIMQLIASQATAALQPIPMVNGLDCPACGHPTLILGNGGYITCSLEGCPNPDYAEAATAAQDRMLEALAYPVKCLKEIDRVCTEELANFSSLHQGKDKESTS